MKPALCDHQPINLQPPHDVKAEAGAPACILTADNPGKIPAKLTRANVGDSGAATLLDRALDYASRGWSVFPLVPGTKVPMKGSHAFKEATTDEATIRKWWWDKPNANIGIATGTASKIFVLDVDVKKCDGFETLKTLEREHTPLPKTYTVQSPTNGRHYYFLMSGDARNSAGSLGPGIDVRGNGGYVVAPPSVVNGRDYRVVNAAQVAEAPRWLLDLLSASSPVSMQTNDLHSASLHPLHTTYSASDNPSITEWVLAKVSIESNTLRALEVDEGAGLVKLYKDLVQARFRARPAARNDFITRAVPFLYPALAPRLVLVLVGCFYDCNRSLFKDSREQHMKEAEAMLASVAQTYRESLPTLERQLYEVLDSPYDDAFRICRDLACLPGRERESLTFFMSFEHLGTRLSIYPGQAQRLMRWFEDQGILELVEKGRRRAPGVRGKAGTYRWLLQLQTDGTRPA